MVQLVPLVFMMLVTTSLLHFMPSFARPDIFFGVTVTRDFHRMPPAAPLVRAYRVVLWCITAAAVVAALTLHNKFAGLVPLVYIVCVLADLAIAHQRALAYSSRPAALVEVDLSAPAERLPGGVLVAILPPVWLVILGIWSVLQYSVPQVPLYRLAGSAWICLMLAVVAWGVLHWSRRISTAGEAAARERRFRRRTVTFVLVCEYFLALPPTFDVLNVTRLAKLTWGAALVLVVIAFVAGLVSAGQGGARGARATEGEPIGDRTADRYWHSGLFYFNPGDPALIVEKRMGLGYTLNFGSPWAWLMLIALVGVPLVVRTMAPR